MEPELSIIVPTHNRSKSLDRCLKSLERTFHHEIERLEVLVVLNNCSDNSPQVARQYGFVRTIESTSTSFSLARNQGAEAACADLLAFIDDDTTTERSFLDHVVKIFKNPEVGMIAGRIEPQFEVLPPPWVTRLQDRRNGLSLFSPNPPIASESHSSEDFEVGGACGPLLLVRKSVLVEAGGFPADTLGVESDDGEIGFTKLYVGPGDFGLSKECQRLGYRIIYSPQVALWHHIPEIRLRPEFWGARFFGEGMFKAQWIIHQKAERKESRKARELFSYRFLRGYGYRRPGEPSHIDTDLAELLGQLATTAILKRQSDLARKIWAFAETGLIKSDLPVMLGNPAFRAFLTIANHDWGSFSYSRWLRFLQRTFIRALVTDWRSFRILRLLASISVFRVLSRFPFFRWNFRSSASH